MDFITKHSILDVAVALDPPLVPFIYQCTNKDFRFHTCTDFYVAKNSTSN